MHKRTSKEIVDTWIKVKGLSRRQAKSKRLEKEWFAVYRHNKNLIIKGGGNTYSLDEISHDINVAELVIKTIAKSVAASKGADTIRKILADTLNLLCKL